MGRRLLVLVHSPLFQALELSPKMLSQCSFLVALSWLTTAPRYAPA
jgi:hypothetical protein